MSKGYILSVTDPLHVQLVVAGFLLPICVVSLRGVYLQSKGMPYPCLRRPVVGILLGALLY